MSSEYKYIALEENYYISVDKDNNIGVYNFKDSEVNLAKDLNIKIDGKDCAKEIKYGLNGNVLVLTYTFNGKNEVVEINLG